MLCADLSNAEMTVLKLVQAEHFKEDLRMIRNGTLPKKNHLYKFDPFLDDDGILHMGGRLQQSTLSFAVRHPIR